MPKAACSATTSVVHTMLNTRIPAPAPPIDAPGPTTTVTLTQSSSMAVTPATSAAGPTGQDPYHRGLPPARPRGTRPPPRDPLRAGLANPTGGAGHLKGRFGTGFNETTADGRFTLKEGECMGACGDAPVLLGNRAKAGGNRTLEVRKIVLDASDSGRVYLRNDGPGNEADI